MRPGFNYVTIRTLLAGNYPTYGSATSMTDALLEARELGCERDDRWLFRGLSFAVREGELVQIEGRNGAGKTTLLRMLAGLYWVQEGQVLWKGASREQQSVDFAEQLLFLGHRTGIKLSLTPRENLAFWCKLHGEAPESLQREALRKVGLKGYETVPCHQLSAGQQRRAALARLFVSQATLWILDEAFTAIDRAGVSELEGWLSDKRSGGGAILLTTHHPIPAGLLDTRINLDELRA